MALKKVKVFTTLCGPYYHIRKGSVTELDAVHADSLAKAGHVEIIKAPVKRKTTKKQ